MATATPNQPDIEAMRATLTSLVAEGRADEAIDAAIAMLVQMRHMHTELLLRVAQLQRERSGRRSEKIDPAQLSLMLQRCEETAAAPSRAAGLSAAASGLTGMSIVRHAPPPGRFLAAMRPACARTTP